MLWTPDVFNRLRPKLNYGAGTDFGVGPEFGATWKQHASNIKYLANLIKKYWTRFRYQKWQIFWCASRPASACRFGGRHLGKLAWGSNLALVFEAVQSRPSTTFPESWLDYWKQYFKSFGQGICLPDSPNWRYRQNYDINKWQVWIREAFLGRISASPEATDGWHHRFSQKWQFGVCKLNFRVCKMPILMKIPMKMKELG